VEGYSAEEVESMTRPLPDPPEGFLRITVQCPNCAQKKQIVLPEAGVPPVGTLLTSGNGFGEQVICVRCRHGGMKNTTHRPGKLPPKSPPGWNLRGRSIQKVVIVEGE